MGNKGIGWFVDSRMRRAIVDDGKGSQSAIRQRNIRLNLYKKLLITKRSLTKNVKLA